VGVVGTGFAAMSHLDALRRLPEVEIVAVAGRDRRRTAALAAEYGVRAYDDVELIEDPMVESVHTCTVNALHHDVNLAALEQGKHVLSEKPLAVDSQESARLAAAAERAAEDGVRSGVCFNYRHYPLVAQIRGLVRAGEHGAPHFIHGRYHQDWLLLQSDWDWRVEEAQGGSSRAVADIGSHWCDLVAHITGDCVTEVLADLGTLHTTRLRPDGDRVRVESEDFGAVMLRFASGARGAFTVSQTSAGSKNGLSFQIDAAEAAFAWDQEQPDRAWVGTRSGPNLELLRDPETMPPRAARLTRLPAGHPEGWYDALRNVFADFYAGIAAERAGEQYQTDVATFAEGHERVKLVEAVISSDRERRWTPVHASTEVTA
jgi:predicted dehydrogenase